MKKNNKFGFTLVELLAVIVILAIILVIAVPQIMSTIEESRKGSLESTAKLIASQAERKALENETLGIEEEIKCEDVASLNDIDYASCSIEFDGNTAKVTLIGIGKFEGLNVCNGTKTNSSGVNKPCSEVCNTNEEQRVYTVVNDPYEVNDIPSCVSVITERLTLVGVTDLVSAVELLCNGQTVDGWDFDMSVNYVIEQGIFTEEELIENNVIKTEEVKVCVPTTSIKGVTYLSNMSKDENARKAFGIITDDTHDKNIRYVGASPKNKVYFNCEEKDARGVSYGEANYNYASSCETWRIIGVFDVEDGSGNTEKRMKIINTNSRFTASWDSSASDTSSGGGVNQWGPSKLTDGSAYAGADLMQLLNGYYIGKSGSECKYNNGYGQDGLVRTCTTESLTNAKMKPLTNKAKELVSEAKWYTYGVEGGLLNAEFYLQERGITQQYTGKSLCEASEIAYCNDKVNRTTSWNGLVGLSYGSDILYANGWLYNPGGTELYPWSISPDAGDDGADIVWYSDYSGVNRSNACDSGGVWPSLYLKSNVQIVGGDGSTEPFKLSA